MVAIGQRDGGWQPCVEAHGSPFPPLDAGTQVYSTHMACFSGTVMVSLLETLLVLCEEWSSGAGLAGGD